MYLLGKVAVLDIGYAVHQMKDLTDEPPRDSLAFRVRTAREAKGLTQQELATMIGVSKATISSWEIGNAFTPRAYTLWNLCVVLGTTWEYLLFGPGDKRRGVILTGDLGKKKPR